MSHLAGNSSTEGSEQDKKNSLSFEWIFQNILLMTLFTDGGRPRSISVGLSDSGTEMNVWYFQQDKTIKCLSGHNYLTLPTLSPALLTQFFLKLSWEDSLFVFPLCIYVYFHISAHNFCFLLCLGWMWGWAPPLAGVGWPAKSVHKWQEETRSQGQGIPRSGALSQSESGSERGGPMRGRHYSGPWDSRQIIPQFLTQTRSTLIHPIIPDGKNKWFHKR